MKEFIVKHESIKTFLKSAMDFNQRDLDDFRDNRLHGYFKNVLHVNKNSIPVGSNRIVVFMEDRSQGGSILVNKYTYVVSDYDSVSYKLDLDDFNVSLHNHETLNLKP